MDITRVWQKPPWQRPNPARVRFLIALIECGGQLRFKVCKISPRDIFSQLQIISPNSGCSEINFSRAAKSMFKGWMYGLMLRLANSFLTNESCLPISLLTTYLAIAGEEANPGDSIPATLIKCPSTFDSEIIKSWVEGVALKPLKVRITWLKGIEGISWVALSRTAFKVAISVASEERVSTNSLLGPTR